jgi:hypothetical protein
LPISTLQSTSSSLPSVDAARWCGSFILRVKTICSVLQLLGATFVAVVVLTHVAETLHLFPWMHWGVEQSIGHYLDWGSAVLGLTLFPLGYFFIFSGSGLLLLNGTISSIRLAVAVGAIAVVIRRGE